MAFRLFVMHVIFSVAQNRLVDFALGTLQPRNDSPADKMRQRLASIAFHYNGFMLEIMKLNVNSAAGKHLSIETSAVHFLSQSERLRQGMKWGGICFLAAVACVFVPVFHFVLVPLCLILSVIFFFKGRKAPWKVENLEFKCPECGAQLHINQSFQEMPLRLFCNECHQYLHAEASK